MDRRTDAAREFLIWNQLSLERATVAGLGPRFSFLDHNPEDFVIHLTTLQVQI